MPVFSIRDALSGKRLACFSTVRAEESDAWALQQLAGKLNTRAAPEMDLVAERILGLVAVPHSHTMIEPFTDFCAKWMCDIVACTPEYERV